MKKSWTLLLTSALLATAWTTQADAVVVVLDQTFSSRQPLQAVVVDSNGKNSQQTVYYDPAIGGVDLDTSWAGTNASVYFPTLNTGYVWYNGNWVNPAGYYWNGGKRYYVGPEWNNYWNGYWRGQNHWNGAWGGGWHGDAWRADGWHGDAWRGDGWHGDAWRGGEVHGGEWRGGEVRGAEWHGGGRGGEWHGGEVHGREWHGGGGHGGGRR